MPNPDFSIKTGDNSSILQWYCENSGGTPVDLAGATGAFKMGPLNGGTLVIAGTAVIDQVASGTSDNTRGLCHYQWASGGVPVANWYRAECEITYLGGSIQTFPNDGYFLIQVTSQL